MDSAMLLRARLFRPLFCLLIAVASLGAHAEGTLVIVGGALRADNAVVWQRIVGRARALPSSPPPPAIRPVPAGASWTT
jgi:hypothetical protein